MKKRFLFPVLTIAILLGTAATAYAITAMTVTEASGATAGTIVSVTGTVTKANGNEYTLSDGVNTITVGFGPTWNVATNLAVDQVVTVEGEIDTGKDGTKVAEIDGFNVTPEGGTKVVVRPGPGKPPWAGVGGPKGKAAGKGGKK
jgi:uncharacterized protein YdeI (BOF family)